MKNIFEFMAMEEKNLPGVAFRGDLKACVKIKSTKDTKDTKDKL